MKQCLIVDDSDVIRKVARRMLEPMELDISEADTGASGIEHCTTQVPDIILLDWLMPEMTGLEFLGALRDARHDRKPYILYCTTENDTADILAALSAGASDYLLKPYTRDELSAKLTRAGVI